MPENFPNLGKETDILFQKPQRAPNKMNPKRSIPRHIVIKMTKVKKEKKKKNLNATRGKQKVIYKGNPIKLSTDFSNATLQARKELHNIKC